MYILNKILKQPTYCLTIDDTYCQSQSVLIDMIKHSKNEITACIYKFNNYDVMFELKSALERGVKVNMIMDYENNFKSKISKTLIDSGAQIKYWKRDQKLHAKFVIIDNHVLTGSFNWTTCKRHKVDLIVTLSDDTSHHNFRSLFNKLSNELINE